MGFRLTVIADADSGVRVAVVLITQDVGFFHHAVAFPAHLGMGTVPIIRNINIIMLVRCIGNLHDCKPAYERSLCILGFQGLGDKLLIVQGK